MTAITGLGAGYTAAVSAHINLTDATFDAINDGPAHATYGIWNDGTVRLTDDISPSLYEAWLQGVGGTASSYEVLVSQTSGTAVSGSSLNTWLNCSTNRSWTLTNTIGNNSTKTAILSVSIRDVATHTVQDTATVTLRATANISR